MTPCPRYYYNPEEAMVEYARETAIDQKILFCLQAGITAEELNSESDKTDEEIRIAKEKEEKEENERTKKHKEWLATHVHQWEKRGGWFEKREIRCADTKCSNHYWGTKLDYDLWYYLKHYN